jgi:5-methyltetrahydropteroyltriglutamate--homocysteine methyltransferase
MASDSKLPHRAEHIGSLLRPREVREGFKQHTSGALTAEAFAEIQDRAIVEAIRLQEDVGLQTITDGEFRRSAWSSAFFHALEGFSEKESLFEFRDSDGHTHRWETCYASGKIRRTRGITTEEFAFVRQHTRRTPKVTMPSPSFLHFFRGGASVDPAVYPDLADFWNDVIAVYRAELAELARIGATYLQIDEVPVAMLCDPTVRERVRGFGEDPERLMSTYVDTVNRILAGRPPTLTVGMHLCRGNFRARWMAEGGYEAIAEQLFQDLAVDAFFLEYDTPRAGDFSPLRFMPKTKSVVLGLVSSKTPVVEDGAGLKHRIDEAARYVELERLALSPQCGFASTAAGNPLTVDDQRRKLANVVAVARDVWG